MTVTASSPAKQHLLGIDVLRFAAALLVVFFHFCYLATVSEHGFIANATGRTLTFPEMNTFSHFGWVGVQVFFVISGFVIAFSGEKATPFGFFASRVVRLGPGAWICAPLTLLATVALGFGSAHAQFAALRHSMVFIPWEPWIDGSYWTLGIEVAFYAMVMGIICVGRFSLIRPLAMALGTVSALFWLAVAVTDPTSALGLQLAAARGSRLFALLLVHHGAFFALGVFLWLALVKRDARANVLWIALLLVVGCGQVAAENAHVNVHYGTHNNALVPCTLWLAAMALFVWSVRANSQWHRLPDTARDAIRTAGMMTFPLYLIHQVAGGSVMSALVLGGWNRWNALAATVALVLATSWVIAKYLEPALQRLTRRMLELLRTRLASTSRQPG